MEQRKTTVATFSRLIHENFLWFLLGSYAVAAVWPTLGVRIRAVSFGTISLFGESTKVTLPVAMLAFLLLNAGLGVQTSQLKSLVRSTLILGAALVANLLVPIAFIGVVSQTMRFWHNPDEVQNTLVGLALIASMPIAGSSTAWSQNAGGNLALSLGLVVFSTILSPLTTPTALHAIGLITTGDYSEDLHELASSGTGTFLAVSVILPSLLGMAGHAAIGEARLASCKPVLKLFNSIVLLLLNYSNASLSLPETISNPDWDFLAIILAIVVSLCVLAFASGWLLSWLFRVDVSQRVAIMFGLGMNNNGTGLVLASMALSDHPRVLLPIIFYNLVQHLVAGIVDFALFRKPATQ